MNIEFLDNVYIKIQWDVEIIRHVQLLPENINSIKTLFNDLVDLPATKSIISPRNIQK